MVSTMTNQEKTKEALAKIEAAVENIRTNEDWLQYLAFQAKFYRYSPRNVLLIRAQNPAASFVKGYKAWHELDRYVKKGARGIAILAPCTRTIEVFKEPENKTEYQDAEAEKVKKTILSGFRIVYVYDISSTDGSDAFLPVLVKGLSGDGEEEKALYERLRAVISQEYTVKEVIGIAANGSAKGSYNRSTGIISIRGDLEAVQKCKTILHELAHAEDFKLNPDDEDIPRNKRELIAESVAFVLSSRLGLDVSRYSTGYIKSWMKDENELISVADTVQRVSAAIIDKLAQSEDFAFLI